MRCDDCGSVIGHRLGCSRAGTVLTDEAVPSSMREPGSIEEYRRGGPPEADPNLILEVRKVRAELARQMAAVPRSVGFSCSGSVASGNLLLLARPGSPAEGRIWHVRGFAAVGGTPVSNVGDAAVVHVFVGPHPPTLSMADIAYAWRDKTTTSLPVPAFYGDYEMIVRSKERLYFVVTAPTAARVYTITGFVKDEPEVVKGAEAVYTQ